MFPISLLLIVWILALPGIARAGDAEGPDLVILGAEGPDVIGTGGILSVPIVAYNDGQTPVSTAFNVALYLSTDPFVTTNDVFLGFRTISGLAPKASFTAFVTAVLDRSQPPGNYYLGAVIDPEGLITETDESNNSFTGNPIEVIIGPDLTMTAVAGPSEARTGDSISITNRAQNIGTGNPGPFSVNFYLSPDSIVTTNDLWIGSRVLAGIAAGQSNSAITSITLGPGVPPGIYYVGAIADASNVVAEVSDNNNSLAGNTIGITQGADLVVAAVSGPATAVTGGSIRITNTVENVGLADVASTFNVGIYISTDPNITTNDLLVGARNVSGLAHGQSNTQATLVSLLPRDIVPGTYYLGVIADRLDVVTEVTKTNNARATDPIQITIGPDLLMTSLSGPSIAYSGGSLMLTSTVMNAGSGSGYDFTIGVYLSSDAEITTNDLFVGSLAIGPGIGAGTSFTPTTTLSLNPGLPLGTYYLGAVVDIGEAVPEQNEGNNSISGNQIQIVAGPDLTVTAISGPNAATTAGTIIVTNVVLNTSSGNSGAFTVGFYLSTDAEITTNDVRIGGRNVNGLAPGQGSTGAVALALSPEIPIGTYFLGAIADVSNVVVEASESNNSLAGNMIAISQGPDLRVTAILGPATAFTGGSIYVTNTVQNSGMADITSSFNVGIYLSTDSTITVTDRLVAARNVAGLAQGQSSADATLVSPLPLDLSPGTYYLGVIADRLDALTETTKTNNVLVGNAMQVSVGPDLVMTTLSGPSFEFTGRSLVITNTIMNAGSGSAYDFTVGFYLSTDPQITTDDLLVGLLSVGIPMVPGSSVTRTTVLDLSPNLPLGTYYLGAVADIGGSVPEQNEANNAITGNQLQILAGPDLAVTALSGPTSGSTLGSIIITNTVHNFGYGRSSPSTLVFYLSENADITTNDLRIGSRTVVGLASDQTDTAATSIVLPASIPTGTYFLGAFADGSNVVVEADEGNNGLAGNQIIIKQGPDLAVTTASGPSSALSGESISIANTVRNLGMTDLKDSFNVGIYLSMDQEITSADLLLRSRNLSSGLDAGQENSANTVVVIPADMPGGTYYLGAIADYAEQVSDIDRTNNTFLAGAIEINVSRIVQVERIEGTIRISFTTVAGQVYRVERTDSLLSANWTTVPGAWNVQGTGGVVTVTDSTNQGAGQFYRVRALY